MLVVGTSVNEGQYRVVSMPLADKKAAITYISENWDNEQGAKPYYSVRGNCWYVIIPT